MSQANQLIPYKLPTQTYSAGNTAVVTLKDLPKKLLGRFAHLVKIVSSVALTPTFTTAPTTVGVNNAVKLFNFWDGAFMRFQGGFNHLRSRERMQLGKTRTPDADTDTASASARYFRRVWHSGPPQFAGAPSDFYIPTGMLENGQIDITYGALTEISADTTAVTCTVRMVAYLALMDEIRIPPAYEYVHQSITGKDASLQGKALYESLALINSESFDAISAGDFGNVTLDLGFGPIVQSVKCADLSASFNDDFEVGQIDGLAGDPEAASDDNIKTVNRGTPTALTAVANDLQPVLWSPRGSRLSKCFHAESAARITWDGSQNTGVALIGRIKEQPQNVVAAAVQRALQPLNGVQLKHAKIRTLSKKPYTGPYGAFMPWAIKVG